MQRRILAVLVGGALSGACTYDFQDFVAQASGGQAASGGAGGADTQGGGGALTGGTSSQGGASNGGAPNSAGASARGGASNGGASGGASTAGGKGAAGGSGGASTSTCAGASLNDMCWYLGAQNQSCSTVCTAHGGVDDAAESIVGVPAQGGSVTTCTAVLVALGIREAPMEATRSDGNGLGCHVYGGRTSYWLVSPRFSTTARHPSASIACGCKE